jgi:hypothetical protein
MSEHCFFGSWLVIKRGMNVFAPFLSLFRQHIASEKDLHVHRAQEFLIEFNDITETNFIQRLLDLIRVVIILDDVFFEQIH